MDDRPPASAVPPVTTIDLIEREVKHLRELYDTRLAMIEAQRLESKGDSKEALAAALQSQEKAANVLATSLASAIATIEAAIDALRVGAVEVRSNRQGGDRMRDLIFAGVAAAGVIFGITK